MDHFILPIQKILAVCLFTLVLQSVALEAAVVQQGQFEELTLDLSTVKEEYRPLEPIPIVLTVSNKTTHVVEGHSELDFAYNYVELYVGRGEGQMKNAGRLSTVSTLLIAEPKTMKPGTEFSSKQLLTLKLDHTFPQPGTYSIQARLFDIDRKRSIASKPTVIRIVPATGIDFQALQFIKTYGNASYFFTGARSDRNIDLLETFAAAFGESAYGDYAAFNMALYRFTRREYDKARDHFEKLSRKPAFVFSDAASDYVGKIKKLTSPEP